MSISRIANNISAINARRNLDKTGQAIQKSIERLSSGSASIVPEMTPPVCL